MTVDRSLAAVLLASFAVCSMPFIASATIVPGNSPWTNTPGVNTDTTSNESSHHCRRGPLVIGHRGASGYRPEHTLASYELAARMGADYIEPDLVSTKDGVLVARHENEISGTTDVTDRPEFADRKTTKIIDGTEITGWFTEDFTLAGLKTLRAVERLPELRQENTMHNDLYEVPTFEEILALRSRLAKELRRPIGVYPETKHPTYFQEIGLGMEAPLVASLERYHLNRRRSPVFVQSFELTNLKELNTKHGLRTNTVFLIWKDGAPYDLVRQGDSRDFAHFTTEEGLETLRDAHIDGVGPEMSLVISWTEDGELGDDTGLVARAHAHHLKVHPYTFRNENTFLPKGFRNGDTPSDYGQSLAVMQAYLNTGIDGFFTDQPDTGVIAVNLWRAADPRRASAGECS